MSNGSLFRRLEKAADPTSAHRSRHRGDSLISALTDHLQKLMNTRLGSVICAPDYGAPTLSDLEQDSAKRVAQMERALKATIVAYEPRLQGVQVREVEASELDGSGASFLITGQLLYPNGERHPMRFTLGLDPQNSFQVR